MRCAFYEKELTPPLGSDIPGYYINRFTEDVKDELYVRAVVFAPDTDDPAGTLAILTLDAVNVQQTLAEAIKARANAFTGIPVENIAVIANHSHYGCPHGDYGSLRDEEFMAVFPRLAGDAITLAYKRLQPCKLTYGMGHEDRCAFVRDYVLDDGAIVTNPAKHKERVVRSYSEADPDLPVLTAWSEDGQKLGVLFTYALHQDTTGGLNYSGDFSSEIAKQLKARYGHKFASIFVPGYCGDINHVDYLGGTKWNHRSIGQLLAKDIIEIVKAAGGVLIQAHPFRNGMTVQDPAFLDGLEINSHPLYRKSYADELVEIAHAHRMIVTSGSDFHGDSYRPICATCVPDTVADEKALAEFLLDTEEIRLIVHEPLTPQPYLCTYRRDGKETEPNQSYF